MALKRKLSELEPVIEGHLALYKKSAAHLVNREITIKQVAKDFRLSPLFRNLKLTY